MKTIRELAPELRQDCYQDHLHRKLNGLGHFLMLLFARKCTICLAPEPLTQLRVCPTCQYAGWCSEEHEKLGMDQHASVSALCVALWLET